MHILIIPSWYPNENNPLSGIFFKEQSEALARQNVKVGCIAINESSPRYIFSKKQVTFSFSNKEINMVKSLNILYPIPNRFKRLRSVVRKIIFKKLFKKYIKKHGKPDLVHLHSFLYGDLALWLKEEYQINYVVTEHSTGFVRNIYTQNELDFSRKIFMNSSQNICVSNEFKNLLEKKFDVDFKYIPNSIDVNYFVPKEEKKNKEDFHFINIAFLDKKKNQAMLIEAFTKAFSCYKNVYLTIVGNGIEYKILDKLIKKLNMQNQIKLYGVANRKEVLELLQSSDVFVLSSKHETFGVVLIEAMSCGLPGVSTKSGGPESIIIDDSIGIVVDNNLDSLVSGLVKAYNTDYNNKHIRNYVIEKFSSEVISKRLIEMYEKIVEEKNNYNNFVESLIL